MVYNNISTNILRDESKDLNYIVTPNAIQIFERMFAGTNNSNKSFTLVGNYGTGKSTFLWALEKNLLNQRIFFSNKFNNNASYEFIKFIGHNNSLTEAFGKTLKIDKPQGENILAELEIRRLLAEKENKGIVIIIDEFGKFLEYIGKNKNFNDLYLIQQISEWVNDETKNLVFIISLHQSFTSYSSNLDISEKLEWEKIKGRFIELLFNEPVEQLLFFASSKLENYSLPKKSERNFKKLNELIRDSRLFNLQQNNYNKLIERLFPLDWLSANILVNALQRYGQNERSLFTFLNDDATHAIQNSVDKFYNVANVFDYLVNTLATEIYSYNNPHRPQWYTAFRALERAELAFDNDYDLAAEIIKTICLINIFAKPGSLFDRIVLSKYIKFTTIFTVEESEKAIQQLEKFGIIRFYKHSNKLNFLEGTDIDIEQELANVTKEINNQFSVTEEISSLVDFPVILVKKNSLEKGTPRFFEFKILNELSNIAQAEGALDGFINLIFDSSIKLDDVKLASIESGSNLFVVYKNSKEIHHEIFVINKLRYLILGKYAEDINAKKLLQQDQQYHKINLEKLVLTNLFSNRGENVWIYNGDVVNIYSKKELNEKLSIICQQQFASAPTFKNELINKEFLSSQITTARKLLIRGLLENESVKNLGFSVDKFPPERSIYISLLKDTGIHIQNEQLNHFEFSTPNEESFYPLWQESIQFINSASTSKRNLGEFYSILNKSPFKLKRGFIEFWIPIFLIIRREDFALFHESSGYIPYLTEEVLELIHKSPTNYSIKSYDVDGLKINLLESYKELVQVGNDFKGSQSTFLSIYGNFLRFYRGLNDYTINTKRLSPKAISLKEAIKNAKDPEDALFNQFPEALGYYSLAIKEDEEVLKTYTFHIQDAIREIRSAYDDLLDRIEDKLIHAFYCESDDFTLYKSEIQNRLQNINISLLGNEQNIFFKRLISPLDERSSWLKSVADAALGKSIDKMIDEEEILLINNLEKYLLGLITASELHEFNSSEATKMISIQMIGSTGNILDDKIIISTNTGQDFKDMREQFKGNLLTLDVHKRKQLLFELLSTELKHDIKL